MVGVPKQYQAGCDACQKQKKRCIVESKTPCTRCQRLKLPCIGYGQKRLTFKQEYQTDDSTSQQSRGNSSVASRSSIASQVTVPFTSVHAHREHELHGTASIFTTPNNILDHLLLSYTQTLTVQFSSSSYSLVTSFGIYFTDVPQRLGYNVALDTAADALVAGYSYYRRTGGKWTEPGCLRAYGRALKALRQCLNSVEMACEIETLFAIMIMFTIETLIGVNKASNMAHSRGAAQVMKHRGPRPPASPVEMTLLLHLRAPVVVQAAYLPYDYFSDTEWSSLVLGYCPPMVHVPEDATFQDLAAAVRLFQRARRVLFEWEVVAEPLVEMDSIVAKARVTLDKLRDRISRVQEQLELLDVERTTPPMQLYQTHGWDLSTAIILNTIIGAFCGESRQMEASQWINRICDIADLPCMPAYRPLGTFWLQLVLYVAYIGAEAQEDKSRVWELLQRYSGDIPGGSSLLEEKVVEDAVRYWRLEIARLKT